MAGLLLLLYGCLTAGTVNRLDHTSDEPHLWQAARSIVSSGDWVVPGTRLQGPLPLYANQLLAFGAEELTPEVLARIRLAMLPFGVLAGLVVFLWARRLFGDAGGLFALGTFAIHPLLFGYGGLIAVDMSHAALSIAVLYAAWLCGERPTAGRVAFVGVLLGAAFATKYLALLLAPVVVLFVAARVFVERRSVGRAFGAAAAMGALALLSLHACYGFQTGFAPGAGAYDSELLSRWVDVPGVGHGLRLFPAAMLQGADYQLVMNAGVADTFLRGTYAAGHPSYHAWGLLLKQPEAVVLAFLAVAVLGLPRWCGRRAEPGLRRAAWLLLVAAAVPFVYLSFLAKLQIGIRYVLPLVPMGLVLLGGIPALPWVERLPRRAAVAGAAVYFLAAGGSSLAQWPNGLGYFNAFGGGPASAWRFFNDSNSDWGQIRRRGKARLTPPFIDLYRDGGPRFGRVAIYVKFRTPRDPEVPGASRHWLDPFDPVEHVGPAWQLYDVTEEAFAAAAEANDRVRADFAVALLGAGRIADARAELAELGRPDPRRDNLLRKVEARRARPDDPATAADLAFAWRSFGRADLVFAVLDATPGARELPAGALAEVLALAGWERPDEAIAVLERRADRFASEPQAIPILAGLYLRRYRGPEAVALIEKHLPALPPGKLADELRALLDEARVQARWKVDFTRSLE